MFFYTHKGLNKVGPKTMPRFCAFIWLESQLATTLKIKLQMIYLYTTVVCASNFTPIHNSNMCIEPILKLINSDFLTYYKLRPSRCESFTHKVDKNGKLKAM